LKFSALPMCWTILIGLRPAWHAGIEPVGPEMGSHFSIDQLCVDQDFVIDPPHAAFQHVAHPELPPDRIRVDRTAFVDVGRLACDDEAAHQV